MKLHKRVEVLEAGRSPFLSYEEALQRLLDASAFPGRMHDPLWADGLARLARGLNDA